MILHRIGVYEAKHTMRMIYTSICYQMTRIKRYGEMLKEEEEKKKKNIAYRRSLGA